MKRKASIVCLLLITLLLCTIVPSASFAAELPPAMSKYQQLFDRLDFDIIPYMEILNQVNKEYGTEIKIDFDKLLENEHKLGLPERTVEDIVINYPSLTEFEKILIEMADSKASAPRPDFSAPSFSPPTTLSSVPGLVNAYMGSNTTLANTSLGNFPISCYLYANVDSITGMIGTITDNGMAFGTSSSGRFSGNQIYRATHTDMGRTLLVTYFGEYTNMLTGAWTYELTKPAEFHFDGPWG